MLTDTEILERDKSIVYTYICEKCNTEYIARDKYELVEKVPHVNFGIDIEEYNEDFKKVNVITECDNCWEQSDETPFEMPQGGQER